MVWQRVGAKYLPFDFEFRARTSWLSFCERKSYKKKKNLQIDSVPTRESRLRMTLPKPFWRVI